MATFVRETIDDSDTKQLLDCCDSHVTVLALATLGDATQIGSFLFGSRHITGGQGKYNSDCWVSLLLAFSP